MNTAHNIKGFKKKIISCFNMKREGFSFELQFRVSDKPQRRRDCHYLILVELRTDGVEGDY